MSQHITLFEYDYLTLGLEDSVSRIVPEPVFEHLEKLCLQHAATEEGDRRTGQLLRLCVRRGHRALQVRNYAGIISTPKGMQIEVLPKLGRHIGEGSAVVSRSALLHMLCHLEGFRHIESADAQVASRKLPLFEVFIRQFLLSINHVVKRGLRRNYVAEHKNQPYQKGRLMAARQLRHNLVHRHRFYVEYDEFNSDRPANRLLHTALRKVAGQTRLNAHQKLCRELLFAFDGVPLSADPNQDWQALKLDRGMEYYHSALAWTRLIIEGISPLSMQGSANAISLLFPMEQVFEHYVASMIRRQLADGYQLKTQAQSKYLVKHGEKRWFRLKPDLMITHGARPVWVMDSKWKLLDASKANGRDKYGLSQADFYQMAAYAQHYLPSGGELMLIYPLTERLERPIEQCFELGATTRLWVVPFEVCPSEENHNAHWVPHSLLNDLKTSEQRIPIKLPSGTQLGMSLDM